MQGFHLIVALKSDRKIYLFEITMQFEEFEKYINLATLDVFTVEDNEYIDTMVKFLELKTH